jgi:hypothetical protein
MPGSALVAMPSSASANRIARRKNRLLSVEDLGAPKRSMASMVQ